MTSLTPWNSIAESVVDYGERRLAFQEGVQSPCATCQTAPCCTHLPLNTFKITNLLELDHAIYLLNFDRIELGLTTAGEWSAYYVHPCRFLNRADFTCTVHNAPQQPNICANYNPYSCWYKRVFTQSIGPDYLRIDRQRLEFIRSQIVFDEFRNIVEVPSWDTMVEAFAQMPLEPSAPRPEPPTHDPILAQWQDLALTLESRQDGETPYSYTQLADPCSACQAYCCTTLAFPHPAPRLASNLDYFRFCLGFPGIELGVGDNGWSIVVRTRCRHLSGTKCGVFNQPERPLLCKYYDVWTCTYRIDFGRPRPPAYVRIRLEQFEGLCACFQFDQDGLIVQTPTAEIIRQYIEAEWRSAVPQPAS